MALNPSKMGSQLNDPTKRANEINDPQFSNQQGYFPYDLTHQEFITPRFGEITPSMHIHTVPGDRIVHHDNNKTIHTKIPGNFLSTVNQYTDTFFVPLRTLFPTNYAKLIPNPTKGDDLPNMALPQFDIATFIQKYLGDTHVMKFYNNYGEEDGEYSARQLIEDYDELTVSAFNTLVSRMTMLAYVLSRGQLLDYLGCSFDDPNLQYNRSGLQDSIDDYFRALYNQYYTHDVMGHTPQLNGIAVSYEGVSNVHNPHYFIDTISTFRDCISSFIEAGKYFYIEEFYPDSSEFKNALIELYNQIYYLFEPQHSSTSFSVYLQSVNTSENPFNVGFINLEKPLAYQLAVAQYFTNDSVDNVFTAELYMQLLRATMFPADSDGMSQEPTFLYNGVTTEYDYISCGATFRSLMDYNFVGHYQRQYVFLSLMFVLRRSLRYGDYFSTARPNMLAVGQLSINVENGKVSPIDVTKNLLMQRYLNAANYIGSGELPYFASIYGVMPSDTGSFPRFVAHRKVTLANDIVTNTSSDLGEQRTNLVGYSDNNAFDVFIDDFGVLIDVVSYDVLPVYKSGIEATYHFADRFDYFNPMLQGVGDQTIRCSEIHGSPNMRNEVFGYTMRNAEYKYKVSRAHGAFVNDLPGFLLSYPLATYFSGGMSINISPDFIRDKPVYFDAVAPQNTSYSPGENYHFIMSCTNVVQSARKIQATPPVLF